jgi:hypothetical protein
MIGMSAPVKPASVIEKTMAGPRISGRSILPNHR